MLDIYNLCNQLKDADDVDTPHFSYMRALTEETVIHTIRSVRIKVSDTGDDFDEEYGTESLISKKPAIYLNILTSENKQTKVALTWREAAELAKGLACLTNVQWNG